MRDDFLTLGTERSRKTIEEITASFHNHLGRTMIAAHRGDWRQAPENSLAAIQYSIVAQADLIEIDVQRTRDGALVLMHDETVDRMTDGTGLIADMTLEELRRLRLHQHQGGECQIMTNYTIPTLEEAMILARNKVMVNLDKCWELREDIYPILLRTDTVKQTLFKSTAEPDEIVSFLQSKPQRPLYMHVLDATNEHHAVQIEDLCRYVQPQAVEICFEQDDSLLIDSALLDTIRAAGCRLWVNTMWDSLCGGHTDARSFLEPGQGWSWHLERGFNMIQTDSAEDLRQYLNDYQL